MAVVGIVVILVVVIIIIIMYQNQLKQVMEVRLPYYGTNKCEPTELFLTINRTLLSVIIKKELAC